MAENIGAAARAMFNFGLTDLRLVNPRDGWPNENVVTMDAGALAKMPPVSVFDTLEEAAANLNFIAATSARPRDMVVPVFTPQSAVTECRKRFNEKQKIGFVFGRERTGLTNDDISLCHAIVTIPANPAFSSLNLAQSVLLMAYEWLKSDDKTPKKTIDPGGRFPAEHKKLDEFLSRLEKELETHHFFRTQEITPTMKRNIRNMFTRNDLTDQEVRTLHGVISALTGKKNA